MSSVEGILGVRIFGHSTRVVWMKIYFVKSATISQSFFSREKPGPFAESRRARSEYLRGRASSSVPFMEFWGCLRLRSLMFLLFMGECACLYVRD